MIESESYKYEDWVGNFRSYMLAWGVPGIIILIGFFGEPSTRTLIWVGALLWKGIACIANASRCGRTHCYFTGPYFLVLAVLTAFHGYEIISLGAYGWLWLGLLIVIGGGGLWVFTEKVWGKYYKFRNPPLVE